MSFTTCKTCNRVIMEEHADKDGNCGEHAKPVEFDKDLNATVDKELNATTTDHQTAPVVHSSELEASLQTPGVSEKK